MSDFQKFLRTFPEKRERIPSWRFVYLNALRAEGVENMTRAVGAAEDAMFQRLQEIAGQPDDLQERAQLQAASDELLKIKIEKLGWPNPAV